MRKPTLRPLAFFVPTIVLSALLVGCGAPAQTPSDSALAKEQDVASTEVAPETEPSNLEIVESGYWIGEYGNTHYALIVENPNAGWGAGNVQIHVIGKDAEGNTVKSETAYLNAIFASGKAAVCGTSYFDEGVKTVEFQLVNSKNMWEKTDITQAEFDEKLHADSVNESTDSLGDTTVSGDVTNDLTAEISSSSVNVLFRGEDGSLLGGASTYLNTLPAGSTAPYTVSLLSAAPAHASVEAYIDCGYLDVD